MADPFTHKRYPCLFPGCERTSARNGQRGLNGVNGYCEVHTQQKRPCVIDGCTNMVAAFNKSGCCKDHRTEGRKLRP